MICLKRGRKLVDFLAARGLDVANRGIDYTQRTYKTIIDLTITSSSFTDLIKNWKISGKATCSDHRMIDFSVKTAIPNIYEFITDTNNMNTEKFRELTEKGALDILKLTHGQCNLNHIELITNMVTDSFKLRSKQSSVTRRVKQNGVTNPWITTEFKKQRKKYRTAKHLWEKKRHCPIRYNNMKGEDHQLSNLLKVIKSKGHKDNMNNILTVKDMARLIKMLKRGQRNEISLVNKADGTYSNAQ